MGGDGPGERSDGPQSGRSSAAEDGIPVDEPDLKSILSRIDDAVFIFAVDRSGGDLAFTFQWNNPSHEAITGMTVEEFGGRRPEEFLGDEAGAAVAEHYRTCVDRREPIEYEETLEHETGEVRWHTKLIPVIEDDRVVQIIGMARDITDLVERTTHIQVIDRVFRHNIRNILTVIQGSAQNIADRTEPSVADEATQILELAEDLFRMSEEARTITEVIIEESSLVSLDVDSLMEEVQREVSAMDHGADVSIAVPESATIVGVPRFSEAVVELVRNAIEHSDRPSPSVEVAVRATDETVELEVADDGPGMPAMERNILVDGQSPQEITHGSGLGTWLVYWIVQKSSGEVAVADRSPRGSVVTLRLPRLQESR